MDCDASLSSESDNDEISRLHKGENEMDSEFSDSGKGRVPILGEITLPELNIRDGDGDYDSEGDEDDASDGYNGVQTIESVDFFFC